MLWRPSQARPASALFCRLAALRRAGLIISSLDGRVQFVHRLSELLMPLITTTFYALLCCSPAFATGWLKTGLMRGLDGFVDSSTEVSFAKGSHRPTAGGSFRRARALERLLTLVCRARALGAPTRHGRLHYTFSKNHTVAKAPSLYLVHHQLTARQEQVKSHSSTVACTAAFKARATVRSRRQSQRARGPCSHPKPPAPTASPSR